jgi:hypothetical protein
MKIDTIYETGEWPKDFTEVTNIKFGEDQLDRSCEK